MGQLDKVRLNLDDWADQSAAVSMAAAPTAACFALALDTLSGTARHLAGPTPATP